MGLRTPFHSLPISTTGQLITAVSTAPNGTSVVNTLEGDVLLTQAVTTYDNTIIPASATAVIINSTIDLVAISLASNVLGVLAVSGTLANLANVTILPGSTNAPPLSTINLNGAALTQASVDGIIAACVAANNTDGGLHISGGTSAAPSVASAANLAALATAGWTVSTN